MFNQETIEFNNCHIELDVNGRFLKIARFRDEAWRQNDPLDKVPDLISILKTKKRGKDIFSFCQRLPDVEPKFNYYMEWDNVAAIPITTFDEWWMKRIPQVTRKNVRRSEKRGVTIKIEPYSDNLVKGIVSIYNESPIRQGRLFWHYGKDFETVKSENASYLQHSDFICAYFQDELIGFIKLVHLGDVAQIMQIISMNKHQDKRTTNALIAKAVAICVEKERKYFVYGKYIYGNNTNSPLIEFKDRNGFEMIKLPRYYIPITLKGELGLFLKLHRDIRQICPQKVYDVFIKLRAKRLAKMYPQSVSDEA